MLLDDFSRLDEVHYSDLYPKSFEEFRKRYTSLAKRGLDMSRLYVQFTSKDNAMDRTAFANPDHSDPVGTYGYPIDYVLKFPADVWYGRGARYLRVLQDTSENTLAINEIESESHVERLLMRMGFDYNSIEPILQTARKTYKGRYTGKTALAKLFLTAVQIDLSEPTGVDNSWGQKKLTYRTRTGAEQTALFLKAGFDAIEDTSRTNKQAVINDREPEQIIFLTRAAFRVLEVVPLRPLGHIRQDADPDKQRSKLARLDRGLPMTTHPTPDAQTIERPFVATIAGILGDKLKDGPERSSLGGWSYYWTKAGRRIEVKFEPERSYYDNKKMGEKKHRAFKTTDQHEVALKVHTEKGVIIRSYGTDVKFKEIFSEVSQKWKELVAEPVATGWQPEDRAGFFKKRDDERSARIQAKLDKERRERIAELPTFIADVKWVADHYGLEFTPNEDYEANEHLMRQMRDFGNLIRHGKTLDDALAFIADDFTAPKLLPLQPQWEQLEAIIRAAWETTEAERGFRVKNGGSGMFEAIRAVLKNWQPGDPTPNYEPI